MNKSLRFFMAMMCFSLALFADQRPNIVFILADDHSAEAVSAYGSKINKTPNIDRLAKEGALLKNYFCGTAVSSLSRASIISGRYSHRKNLLKSKRLSSELATFPKLLKKAGYQMGFVGQWYFSSRPKHFDYWEILSRRNYYNPQFYKPKETAKYEGYITDIITDLGLNWLKTRDKNKPFLLMFHHRAPHRAWAPNVKYLKKYDGVKIPEPVTLYDKWDNRSRSLKYNWMSIDRYLHYTYDFKIREKVPFASQREASFKDPDRHHMTREQKKKWDAVWQERNHKFLANPPIDKDLLSWKYQRFVKNYIGCIDSIDEGIGRTLDYLDKEGLSENTIVIYSSDQGVFVGEHGWYGKGWMFEEGIRSPLLFRWPKGIKAGTRLPHITQNVDLAPSILEAVGLSKPRSMDGESFLSYMKKPTMAGKRKYLYYLYRDQRQFNIPAHEGVRSKRYKLIHFFKTREFNLFDLEKDPNEMKDISKEESSKKILQEMKKHLSRLRKEQGVK